MAKAVKTRNGGKLTEAQYWGKVRSALRKSFARWAPAEQHLKDIRLPYKGETRHKWVYPCESCGEKFFRTEVRSDHRIPVGRLLSLDDLPGFLHRLTPESPDAFQCLCQQCHQDKTNADRKVAKSGGDVIENRDCEL